MFDVSFTAARRQVMEIVGTEGLFWWSGLGNQKVGLAPNRSGLDEQDGPGWRQKLCHCFYHQLEVEAFCIWRTAAPAGGSGGYRNMLVTMLSEGG